MKTNKQWTAALCMIAMAGCASDRMSSDTSSSNSGYTPSGTSSTSSTSNTSGTGSSGSSGSSTSPSGGGGSTPMTSSSAQTTSGGTTTGSSSAQTSYGVVQAIDQMQRQDVGVGVVGAAAVGGSTSMPTDKVYRVTIRTDDGSNQMVVVDSMPSYKIGDRVRYSNGTVVAY